MQELEQETITMFGLLLLIAQTMHRRGTVYDKIDHLLVNSKKQRRKHFTV